MLLQWTETTPIGEQVLREGNQYNVRNVQQYARPNCRRCHGRGVETWDCGYRYVRIDQPPYVGKVLYNPRKLSCECVDRNLQRIEDAKTK